MTSALSFLRLDEDTVFQKNWQAYQIVLRENYNRHAELYEKIPDYLQQQFPGSFSILDLGCGDADYLSKTLLKHHIWPRITSYTGVDLSEQAMQIGEQNVRSMLANGAQCSFIIDNMLNFVSKAANASYDFVFASVSVHHLQDIDKERLVHEVRRILKPHGAFMVVDIFLQENEDRNSFMEDFATNIRHNWVKLNAEQMESFANHVLNFDFPAKLTTYEHWAKQNSTYKDVKCLQSLRFYKTVVLET